MANPNAADTIIETLLDDLRGLSFTNPASYVYNPLEYARVPFDQYMRRFGDPPREILMMGMNPGPWGMLQTGVPFGEIEAVTKWMGIDGEVEQPAKLHPKRPVMGMGCKRSEVSGKRLWGWARDRFGAPENFFRRFLVINYCPLAFFDEDGKNLTPDKLPAATRKPLLEACNRALHEWVEFYKPRYVIGIGGFAAKQAESTVSDLSVKVGRVTHPSPANPRANRGWSQRVESELEAVGIVF